MTRQNNDSPAVPEGRRKTIQTEFVRNRGGKRAADDELVIQLSLVDGTAANGTRVSTDGTRRSKRKYRSVVEVYKPACKAKYDEPATLERK